jgi:ankyrin repeat protein
MSDLFVVRDTDDMHVFFHNGQVGSTALHIAASMGYNEVVAVLLESGADPRCLNSVSKIPSKVILTEARRLLYGRYFVLYTITHMASM